MALPCGRGTVILSVLEFVADNMKIPLPYWAATVGRERTAIALCVLTAPEALPILRHPSSPVIRKSVLSIGSRCSLWFVTLQNSHFN